MMSDNWYTVHWSPNTLRTLMALAIGHNLQNSELEIHFAPYPRVN